MSPIIIENPLITKVNREQSVSDYQEPAWKAEMAAAFSSTGDLLGYLGLPLDHRLANEGVMRQFPLRVTATFASRMKKGDPDDPLLLQVLPLSDELLETVGYGADPVGDLQAIAVPGLLHKYHGRALLIVTGACAINCRYCFRREFPYSDGQLTRSRFAEALAHIAQDANIAEIILSGGDPLMLDDGRLTGLLEAIAAIPHVSRLRVHTRIPIVLPSRITKDLPQILAGTRLKPVMVIHANHSNEFNAEVSQALSALQNAGVALLNQSVLLKAVNDNVDALSSLSVTLFENGVLPYYLHLLDKANGTAHFDIPEKAALALYEKLRRCLPGYLVPKLVREIVGAPYKVNLV